MPPFVESDARLANSSASNLPPALAGERLIEPRTEVPFWLFESLRACETVPWRGDSVVPPGGGVVPGGASVALTEIDPFISVGWTGQMKV